jgi:ubiquinone/menaquinone biosynthesis C-methylase UbiE
MKTRNPRNKFDLSIRRKDCVLEVGCGNHPTYRSNVVVDKHIEDNYHRGSDLRLYKHQKFVNADGENLPFKDNEFDYAICCHVLEHVDNPEKFVKEQSRVAKRGYMEVPSLISEFLTPKESHRWVTLEIDDKLVLYEKSLMPSTFQPDFGMLFIGYLPHNTLAYRMLCEDYSVINSVKYEWKNEIDILVNPQDEYYSSFFLKKWTAEMTAKIFPPYSNMKKIFNYFRDPFFLLKETLRNKMTSEEPLPVDEYLKLTKNRINHSYRQKDEVL